MDHWRLGHRPAVHRLRGVAVLLVLLGLALVLARPLLPANAKVIDECAVLAGQAKVRDAQIQGHGPLRVSVLGDSYAQGVLLAHPSRSWQSRLTEVLDATVTTDGLAGTGFTASPCGPRNAFTERALRVAASHPDIVIVEGGLNDTTAPDAEIAIRVRAVVADLRGARVFIVGPTNAPQFGEQAKRVDHVLATTAHELGVGYISTFTWTLPYLSDRTHLTAAGHRLFGDRVARELAERLR